MSYAPPSIRVFLLSVNGNREMYQNYLDTRSEILNWFGILPNTLLLASRSDVSSLTNLLHSRFPHEWFVVAEVEPTKTNGFINRAVWDFVNSPRSSGRWE